MREENTIRNNQYNFEIVKHIGIIDSYPSGWTKEINLVSWNGNDAKYDIREWSPEHDKMSRGLTLTKEEVVKLMDILSNMEVE